MAGETQITLIGNLTDDPELRYTPSGAAVVNFTVASTPRVFDQQAREWRDGDPLFLRCTLWRQPAEHLTESLSKGARVILTGRPVQRSFDAQADEKRTVTEVQVDEIGPSLRYATATVTKPTRARSSRVADEPTVPVSCGRAWSGVCLADKDPNSPRSPSPSGRRRRRCRDHLPRRRSQSCRRLSAALPASS